MQSRMGRMVLATVFLVTATACEMGERGEAGEIEEETPGLAARAKVDGETARATALARVGGGEIVGAELEEEDGRLVYSFDIKVEGVTGVEEVLVDAVSGNVVSQEHESEAQEAAEADDENEADEAGEMDEGTLAPGAVAILEVEDSTLLVRAKVTDEAARAAALARVPGGRIVAAELEEEDGSFIFSYDVKVEGKKGIDEVWVDAVTGQVIKVEHEGEEGA